QMVAADLGDEPEAYTEPEEELVAEPVADIPDDEEPPAEPEPDPEPEPEPGETDKSAAPWLQRDPEPEADPPLPAIPRPEPVRVRRRQSRLERALRGKGPR
ncbi:MAG: hypothetical protein ACR2HC_10290, partial [Thermoleophilaceae bacterium]